MEERKEYRTRREKKRLRGPSRAPCPLCGKNGLRRIGREGFIDMVIRPLFGYYPWICYFCREKISIKLRSWERADLADPETETEVEE